MGVEAVWAEIPKGVGLRECKEHDRKAACGRRLLWHRLHCTVPRRC